MADPCPDCGRDRVLVGIRHNCNALTLSEREREILGMALRKSAKTVKPPSAGEGASVVAGLRSRIVELEAELKHAIKTGLEAATKYQNAEDTIVTLRAKLVTLQKKGADRVKKHRAKKKSNG